MVKHGSKKLVTHGWWDGHSKRHPDLVLCTPACLLKARMLASDRDILDSYFKIHCWMIKLMHELRRVSEWKYVCYKYMVENHGKVINSYTLFSDEGYDTSEYSKWVSCYWCIFS